LKKTALHIILIASALFFIHNKGIAQKTDTVIHINGNILTGDLKKMVYGVATWKMDGMGTISLEEVKINTIKSKKLFEIKMKSGEIHFGSFDTSHVYRKVYIIETGKRQLINIDDVVEIYPIKRNFWMRSSGNFSLGANFSKGSNVGSIIFSGSLDYRKKKTYIELSWDDNNTYQGDTLSSSNSQVGLGWQRQLKKSWSAELAFAANQNTELGTKLRLAWSLMGLKDISYNKWNRLYAGTGLSVARETPYDDSGITNDLAAIVQVVWKVYKYTAPKVWVNASIDFLPYLTGESRYRSSININPQVSIFSDNLKIGLSMYYNFDSNPSSDASKDDYGTNLQLTYSFH
jgi:hypothetical protein